LVIGFEDFPRIGVVLLVTITAHLEGVLLFILKFASQTAYFMGWNGFVIFQRGVTCISFIELRSSKSLILAIEVLGRYILMGHKLPHIGESLEERLVHLISSTLVYKGCAGRVFILISTPSLI
jgi:hypothetical protein